MNTSKDFYSLLGVARSASQEEIRNAYISRSRILHPDRFDPKSQPSDWKKANEMLAELNEAFGVLNDQSSRRQYDDATQPKREQSARSKASAETSKNRASEKGGPRPLQKGSVNFKSLPHPIQITLLRRQSGDSSDQFQLKTSSLSANYLFITILMGWFCFLLISAIGDKWKGTFYWYGGISCAVGFMLAANFLTLIRTWRTTLHSYFYVTPLYFIQTDFDIITFYPIRDLVDLSVTHNFKDGKYASSTVTLKFESDSKVLNIPSKFQFEAFMAKLKTFDTRARTEYQRGNIQYFVENDYFYQVDSRVPPANTDIPNEVQMPIYGACAVASIILFMAAHYYNKTQSVESWVKHTSSPSPAIPVVERVPEFTIPEQPLPANGSKQGPC